MRAQTPEAALFQPLRGTGAAITADGVYKCVLAYAAQAKIKVEGFGVHSSESSPGINGSSRAAIASPDRPSVAVAFKRPSLDCRRRVTDLPHVLSNLLGLLVGGHLREQSGDPVGFGLHNAFALLGLVAPFFLLLDFLLEGQAIHLVKELVAFAKLPLPANTIAIAISRS